ncbi:hypothetical protein Tco_1437565 [Tanacetum coccineum]
MLAHHLIKMPEFVKNCGLRANVKEKTSHRDGDASKLIQVVKSLTYGAFGLYGPCFPSFQIGNKYILRRGSRLFVKMVERKRSPSNDARVVCKFLKSSMPDLLSRLSTVISPQYKWASGCIKSWFEKKESLKGPSLILVWKGCHLTIELEHNAYRALKQANFDPIIRSQNKELMTPRSKTVFSNRYRVLLFIFKIKFFSGQYENSRCWNGPFTYHRVFPYWHVERSQCHGPKFQSDFEWSSRQALLWRERTTLGSSRSPNFPQGSINPCDGSSIATLNKRFVGGTPCLSVVDCPDCEDSQFCHSSRVSHLQLQLGIRYPNLID